MFDMQTGENATNPIMVPERNFTALGAQAGVDTVSRIVMLELRVADLEAQAIAARSAMLAMELRVDSLERNRVQRPRRRGPRPRVRSCSAERVEELARRLDGLDVPVEWGRHRVLRLLHGITAEEGSMPPIELVRLAVQARKARA